jgi:transcriptional regulator GlxA family with amidase domain
MDLKIAELANMSGFNSVVSYNMAFRLFMNENPSEWCRKERAKSKIKKK